MAHKGRGHCFRSALYLGTSLCMCLIMNVPSVQAQNVKDPFAPDAVAPLTPSAAPHAPTPVAPKLPPLPEPAPAPPPVAQNEIPLPSPTENQIQAIEQPATPSVASTAPQAPTPASEEGPSFWDRLSSLFQSNEKPPQTVEQETPTQTPLVQTPPPTELQAVSVTQPETKAAPSLKTVTTSQPSPHIDTTLPQEALTPSTSKSADPFTADAVAPTLPNSLPQVAPPPPLMVEAPTAPQLEPKASIEPSLVENVEPIPTPKSEPSEAMKPMFRTAEPTQSAQQHHPAEEENPSLFERLGNLFRSEPEEPTKTALTEEEKDPVPLPAKTEPAQVAKQDAPQRSLGDALGNLSSPSPEKIPEAAGSQEPVSAVSQPAAREASTRQPVSALKPAEPAFTPTAQEAANNPFAAQKVATTTPAEPPLAPQARQPQTLLPQPVEAAQTPVTSTPASTAVKEEAPTSQPVMEIAKQEEESPGFFQRIGNFFSDTFSSESDRAIVVEEEQKKQTQPAPALKEAPAVFTAQSQENKLPSKAMDPRLVKAKLGLGNRIKLGEGDNALSPTAKCFTKNRGTVTFCLTPTQWPQKIEKYFDVSSHLYKGNQGIVQFDGNVATRLFTMFKGDGIEQIISYYENKYGPATHTFQRKTRTVKQGTVENPTWVWRKENLEEGLVEVLEVRKIADMRGSIPDMARGSIRVYFEGAREIFAMTSDLDYMQLR